MSSYKTWLKRKENATPYANEANCRKCRYGEWVRTSAFCTGQGKPKKIPYKAWDTDKTGYCPEFMPRKEEEESCSCIVMPMIASGMKTGSAKGLCSRQDTQRCTSGRIGTDGNSVMTSRMKRSDGMSEWVKCRKGEYKSADGRFVAHLIGYVWELVDTLTAKTYLYERFRSCKYKAFLLRKEEKEK